MYVDAPDFITETNKQPPFHHSTVPSSDPTQGLVKLFLSFPKKHLDIKLEPPFFFPAQPNTDSSNVQQTLVDLSNSLKGLVS